MRLRDCRVLIAALVVLLGVTTPAAAQLRAITYASGLSSPLGFVQDPSDAAVQYVVEQGGRIKVVYNGVLQTTPFLDISSTSIITSGGERGLLGLAFPPNYGASGRFYVFYTRSGDGALVVARFKRSAGDRFVADAGSRFPLIWSTGQNHIPHPGYSNHNAGCIAFGSDGMLYIATGDGGGGGDPNNNSQNTSSLLGKVLRIDVSSVPETHLEGFVIPTGNAGLPRAEIWSLGWRNPWRFSFDSLALGGTGAMIVADVGQGAREEIDYEPRGRVGRNYGWRLREGFQSYDTSLPAGTLPLTNPIFDYDRIAGRSVTGGYVYRGASFPELRGRYIFGDYATRRVWSLALTIHPTTGEATASDLIDHTAELGQSLGGISSFGADAQGEVYIVDHTRGLVLKLSRGVPRPPTNVRVIRD